MNSTLDLMHAHTSCRRFASAAIDDETLTSLIKAGQAASTYAFLQCVHLIDVQDPSTRAALADIAGQLCIQTAGRFLVFCADFTKHQMLCPNADFEQLDLILSASVDAGIMAQNTLLAAQSMGLSGVYISGIRKQMNQTAELLALPAMTVPLFGLCLGVSIEDKRTKSGFGFGRKKKASPPRLPRLPTKCVVSVDFYQACDSDTLYNYSSKIQDVTGKSWQRIIESTLNRPHRGTPDFLAQRGFGTTDASQDILSELKSLERELSKDTILGMLDD